MNARVFVTLKPGVLDPVGQALSHSLAGLGYTEVGEVRVGKVIELTVAGSDRAKVRARVDEMCQRLLANTVIEDYRIEGIDP